MPCFADAVRFRKTYVESVSGLASIEHTPIFRLGIFQTGIFGCLLFHDAKLIAKKMVVFFHGRGISSNFFACI